MKIQDHTEEEIRPSEAGELWEKNDTIYSSGIQGSGHMFLVGIEGGQWGCFIQNQRTLEFVINNKNGWKRIRPPVHKEKEHG